MNEKNESFKGSSTFFRPLSLFLTPLFSQTYIDLQNNFEKYIRLVSKKFQREQTSEMGYRTSLKIFLTSFSNP
jgi:hypothetical protein